MPRCWIGDLWVDTAAPRSVITVSARDIDPIVRVDIADAPTTTEDNRERTRHAANSPRPLAHDQTCVVYVVDVTTGKSTEVYRTTSCVEAPNWIDEHR